MTGVSSVFDCQPTGGEAGGEMRNCLDGWGGAKWKASPSFSRVWTFTEMRGKTEYCFRRVRTEE